MHFDAFSLRAGGERPLVVAAVARHNLERRVFVLAVAKIAKTTTFRY